ncbi:endonuclease/exonuclease/phosphatase family protein [Marinifilum sp. D714]|uniref:endonuclease/exonuclease/phosphatase family protein n=1 Tax=Marinifilum sp. D714 TaxID=2937523 RepID=UPI0027C183C6|nr:endonuclease/exonuclease/phosphatase family protein [Marinifilum sp. D714]MDQ2179089.1 endonuclease/exonuclease/phosphatase family protein [Marinifilum sp. D714]
MKKVICNIIIILGLLTNSLYAQKFMTYNLRYDNPNDGINKWELRKENIIDLICEYHPDVFGTQEGLCHQLEFLDSNLTGYSYVGVGRDDGKKKGEYCAIFYKHSVYKIVKESTFWLSTTPNEISVGWDAVLERICTYALFEDKKSGKQFWVFNAHFDHVGEKAQYESAKLILRKIQKLNQGNLPVVLMGDLNLKPKSEAIKYLADNMIDSHLKAEAKAKIGTFNAFKHDEPVTDRIDYIFVDNSTKIVNYKIIDLKVDGRYPSDHLPVMIEIKK